MSQIKACLTPNKYEQTKIAIGKKYIDCAASGSDTEIKQIPTALAVRYE